MTQLSENASECGFETVRGERAEGRKYVGVDCRVWSLRATAVPGEVQTHIRASGGVFLHQEPLLLLWGGSGCSPGNLRPTHRLQEACSPCLLA